MMLNRMYENLDDIYDEIVEVRRYLHKHPELANEEYNTSKFIADYHKKIGHKVRVDVGGNGVLAYLKGDKPGPTVALRADFDALPIQEETDVPFKSINDGVMHACGHDGHTASLLGLAKVLNGMKQDIKGTVVFIHQHAEELFPGGAKPMIEDGCLDGVDVIFGIHLQPQHLLGEVLYHTGASHAAADSFTIKIKGKGGHGARPHETKDSIVVAGQLINNLQQIVSRRVSPLDNAVLSIGSIEAKNPMNVIADVVTLAGTVRTFNEDVRDFMEEEIERVIKGTCIVSDVTYDFKYDRGYPPTVNHKEEAEFAASLAKDVPGVERVIGDHVSMGADDYAYYLQKIKGAYIRIGAQNPKWEISYPNHHPKFDIDERALLISAKVLGAATIQYLENN